MGKISVKSVWKDIDVQNWCIENNDQTCGNIFPWHKKFYIILKQKLPWKLAPLPYLSPKLNPKKPYYRYLEHFQPYFTAPYENLRDTLYKSKSKFQLIFSSSYQRNEVIYTLKTLRHNFSTHLQKNSWTNIKTRKRQKHSLAVYFKVQPHKANKNLLYSPNPPPPTFYYILT